MILRNQIHKFAIFLEKLKYKSALAGPKIKRKQTWLFGLQIGATLFQIGVRRDENGDSYS